MKRRSRGARWFVLGFYILGVEALVIAHLMPIPNFWIDSAPLLIWGIALLLMAWDLRLFSLFSRRRR